MAAGAGIVRAGDHIVVVHMVHQDFLVKIVTVDDSGESIAAIRPKSLLNIVKASRNLHPDAEPWLLAGCALGAAHLLQMQLWYKAVGCPPWLC